MQFNINKKLLIKLVVGIFITTIVGTLSHELGHCLAAKPVAYPGSIRLTYESMTFDDKDKLDYQIYILDTLELRNPVQQERYEALKKKYVSRRLQVSVAGPAITILIGLIGLVVAMVLIKPKPPFLTLGQWIVIFLSLFWLRPVGILASWLLQNMFGGRTRCDETRIAGALQINEWITIVPGGLIGVAVGAWIFFTRIPAGIRATFLLSMIIGSPLAYFCWFHLIGPVVLPYK